MIGIYKITNTINGKSYIGQSVDIYRRWKREKEDSNNINSRSYDYPLMKAFRKYGIENFNFEIIEECKIEELNENEIYWIDFYDTFFHGYNQTLGGDTTLRQPKEKIIGVISDLINTDMMHKDIAAKWDISTEMVQGINTGRYWKRNTEYPLQKREVVKFYCEKCGKEITKGSKLCFECYSDLQTANSNKPSKEILIEDIHYFQGNFTKIGNKYGVTDNTIRKWCNKYEIPSQSSYYKTVKKEPKEKNRPFKIGVVQLNIETGEEINYFNSISDAARSLGLNNKCCTHISDSCKGTRKSAYGYKWKFL